MEMVDAYDGKPQIEKLNGRLYYMNLVRKVQLFPLQEGKYTLDPAEIESVVHFIKTDEPPAKKNPGNAPMYPAAISHRTILRTEPKTITVKPLPTAKQPDDFSGAVGQFAVIVKAPNTPIHQGDLVKIQVTISGSGNLSLLTPPAIKWPKGVDTAEPSVKENINKYNFPLSGSKTFEYSFAAPDTGDYVIPAVHFPYYDPAEKKYKKAASDSITLHVFPGIKKADAGTAAGVVSKVPAIRPTSYWFAFIVVVILACIAFQFIALRKLKKKAELKIALSVPAKEAPAPQKTATELLASARLALQYNRQQTFYHEVQQVLWQVVSDSYRVLPSKMNKYHITELLTEKEVPAETIRNLLAVLDECEWALYTPGQSVTSMEGMITKAEGLLKELLEVRS
jgi:hypothetical protein